MVKMTITVPGEGLVEIEATDTKAVIEEASFWQSLPRECPVCRSELRFFHFTPQKYVYYGLVCKGETPHKVNFGQHMDGGSLFYDKNKTWEIAQFQQRPSDVDPELNLPAPTTQPVASVRETIQKQAEQKTTAKEFNRDKTLHALREKMRRLKEEYNAPPRLPSQLPAKKSLDEYNDAQLKTLFDHVTELLRAAMDAKIENEEREAMVAF